MPTALVTGASAGLGTHFALALAQRGHHLVLVARRGDRLDQLAELITRRHNVSAHVIVADLAKKNAVARLAAELDARELTIDILVNNVGFGARGDFAALDRAVQARMQTGSASCRERECEYVEIVLLAVSLIKNTKTIHCP